jgi:RNA polymerase sigma-70 factor (ECF subfamily)
MTHTNHLSIAESAAAALAKLPDDGLVGLAKAGDSRAFTTLVERNRDRIFKKIHSILRRIEDAQDVLQESFLKAWLHLDRFEEKAQFSTWLTRIAINESLMLMRKRRRAESCDESYFDISDSRLCPQQRYLRCEASAFVWREVARLPEELQEIFRMYYVQELPANEVACKLALSEAAVKSRLYRGRLRLREKALNPKSELDVCRSVKASAASTVRPLEAR